VTESRPYVIQTVIDAKTEKRLSVEEAVKAKILDQKRGVYVNSNTGEELTLADALDSGLLQVEFEEELANGNGSVTLTALVSIAVWAPGLHCAPTHLLISALYKLFFVYLASFITFFLTYFISSLCSSSLVYFLTYITRNRK